MIKKRVCSQMMLWMMIVLLAVPPGILAQTAGPPPPPPPPAAPQAGPPSAPLKQEELDQLLAPIALYPDALLAQVLMASTYPLEVVQAARWVKANPNVKDKQLENAMQQQPWDPSVKSLAALPQVLQMMNDKLDWTQKLGDAFLAQEKELMDTVQKLRAKAEAAGNLKSTPEQKIIVEQQVIRIEPASPQVVYVPTYNPTVVYGAWPYPAYPPYYYYPPGYVAAASIFSFGVGVAVGAALWGGCNWNSGSVNVNVNNYNNYNRTNISNTNWQHNVDHRKGVPYRDANTRQQYGRGQQPGANTREAYRGRAEQGRQQMSRESGPGQRGGGGQGGSPGVQQRGGASAFNDVGRGGDVKQSSNRGQESRQSMSRPSPQRSTGGSSGGSRAGGGGGSSGGRGGGGGGGRRK